MKNPPMDPRRNRGTHRLALALATLVLAYTPTAQAYIDPGTGSLLLQGLIAAIAGIAVTAGIFWERVKAFFRRARDDPEREHDPHGLADGAGSAKRARDDD